MSLPAADATSIATAIRGKEVTAKEVVAAALARVADQNHYLNCFTTVIADRAMADADRIDQQISQGIDPGVLAGVPVAVKDLFDIAGVTTLAGSKINADNPPASHDATLVTKLKQAGAIVLGGLTMDEYAYGFTTENRHYGNVRNPHNGEHSAGGSSGGCGASIAAGLVALSLGSDTNGSIRVPASFCGIFGLKPTYGRLSRAGAYPFCGSFDHVGPYARSTRDLALAFDVLQGFDPEDPVSSRRPPQPCQPELAKGIDGLRIAVADGHFAKGGMPEVFTAVETVAKALGASDRVIIPEARRARAAAFVITASEGANLHLQRLKTRPEDFDPATRDRFLAGALMPATWYLQAQRFREWYRDQVRHLFESVDIILAPTTPCPAPLLGQKTMVLDGEEMLVRPNIGLYTQSLSFIGLPIVSVPIQRPGQLPLGVQVIAAPYNEALVLRVAAYLEAQGVVAAPIITPKSPV